MEYIYIYIYGIQPIWDNKLFSWSTQFVIKLLNNVCIRWCRLRMKSHKTFEHANRVVSLMCVCCENMREYHYQGCETEHQSHINDYCLETILDFNSSPPGQNGHHLADDIFRCIFVNEYFCILLKISLKFVPRGPIDTNPVLVQIMACRRKGVKPLFEPMLRHFRDAYMRR